MTSAWLLLLAQQASDASSRVGSGRIQGGWEYVWASYAITWGAIILYTIFLWRRRPEATTGKPE
jgi:hypothetical protein